MRRISFFVLAAVLSGLGCEEQQPPAPVPAPKPAPPVAPAPVIDAGAADEADAGDSDAGVGDAAIGDAGADDAGADDAGADAGEGRGGGPTTEAAGDAGAADEDLAALAADAGPRVLQLKGKPALFVWSSSDTKEEAEAQLKELERMLAAWPELDGLNVAPSFPRIITLGELEHLVVLGTCGPDTADNVDRALAVVRLGRPSADLKLVEHKLNATSNCPHTTGEVVVLPEVVVGKNTFATAVVKRHQYNLNADDLATTWDSLTLGVLRGPEGEFGQPGRILDSTVRDIRRCADPVATEKKGTLVVVQRCVASDCSEASSIIFSTATTTWSVKGQKLVSSVKAVKKAGPRCDQEDQVVDP